MFRNLLFTAIMGMFVIMSVGCGESSNGPAKLPSEKEFKPTPKVNLPKSVEEKRKEAEAGGDK